jgi:hypothetical protein
MPEKKGMINIMTYNTLSLKGGVTVEVTDNGGGIARKSLTISSILSLPPKEAALAWGWRLSARS